jgi:hypothetical protein
MFFNIPILKELMMTHPSHLSPTTRRRFISGCAACAGCAVSAFRRPLPAAAAVPSAKPKVRLVFCETANDKPIWPNIGYDFDSRREQITDALAKGCPDVDFLPAILMDDPKQAAEVLNTDSEVQGYMLCLQGLGWSNDISKLSATGKPTLIADNLFGGSGLFLTRLPQIMNSGHPVDWISSSRDGDMVSVAKKFSLLNSGKSAAEIAKAFRSERRIHTPGIKGSGAIPDPLTLPDFGRAWDSFRKTRLLVVGGSGGEAFSKAAHEVFGIEILPVAFEEMSQAYEQADTKQAGQIAERWISRAHEVVEPGRDEIVKSAAMYLAMRSIMDKYQAKGITVNCLGGFYGGHLKAYPCLGFSQMNDDGLVGGCEADRMSALTMLTVTTLTGRPGFISDPVIDTSKRAIIYAHCVAMTKPFGPDGPASPYRLRSHSEDRKGASMQSLLPPQRLTTTLEINPQTREILMHQAYSIRNNSSDMACRTKLEALVFGDIESLAEKWRMGWHRVTFYGDLKDVVTEIAKRANFKLIQEA